MPITRARSKSIHPRTLRTLNIETLLKPMWKFQEQEENCGCLAPGECFPFQSKRASQREKKTIKVFMRQTRKTFLNLRHMSVFLHIAQCFMQHATIIVSVCVLSNDVIRTSKGKSRKTFMKNSRRNIFALTQNNKKWSEAPDKTRDSE